MNKIKIIGLTFLVIISASCVNKKSNLSSCFIAQEGDQILSKEGECATAYSPQSTFKIILSLIGFDAGILRDEQSPLWSMPAGADPYTNVCKVDHNPRTWIRDSCLWYSNILTTELGMEKFQNYINKFSYGNKNLAGGLTSSWVSSFLKISPEEYIEFLVRLVEYKLPISNLAYEKTKNIMYVQELPGGWKLYGKTGNGSRLDKHGRKTAMQQGWFVGYIEKNNKKIVFVSHIVDDEIYSTFASMRARNEALLKLWPIINNLEK